MEMEALQRVATSMKTSKRSRTLAYLTGAGSVLDLTGYSRWFEELAPGRPRDRRPAAGPEKDFAAVGKHLNFARAAEEGEAARQIAQASEGLAAKAPPPTSPSASQATLAAN